jgi:hypothetical protein
MSDYTKGVLHGMAYASLTLVFALCIAVVVFNDFAGCYMY